MIIAIANQKGGTGKTTTAINLGAALCEHRKKVLVVDFDPQGSATLHSGLKPDDQEKTVWTALSASIEQVETENLTEGNDLRVMLDDLWQVPDTSLLDNCIVANPGGNPYDLVPANLDLSDADLALVSAVSRERHLTTTLRPAVDRYDYILIDCPPHLGLLTINALTAADSVIVPLQSSYLASKGMNQLFRTIIKVKRGLNHRLNVLGVLLTMVDLRTVHSRDVAEATRKALEPTGIRVFATHIPQNVDLADAAAAGKTVLLTANSSKGAEAYRELAKEIHSA